MVWVTDGAAGTAAAKTAEGGAGMAGAGSTGCRAGAGAVRVTESSGGADRFGVSVGAGRFAGGTSGRGATKGGASVFFTLNAAAGTDRGAGTYNCIAMYRGGCGSNGKRTCKTSRRMPRWIATLPAREADLDGSAGCVV